MEDQLATGLASEQFTVQSVNLVLLWNYIDKKLPEAEMQGAAERIFTERAPHAFLRLRYFQLAFSDGNMRQLPGRQSGEAQTPE